MRNILLDTARFIVISFELPFALLLFAIYLYVPDFYKPIGTFISSTDLKMVLTLVGLPIAGLIYGYHLSNELTVPKDITEEAKKRFLEWKNYPLVRNRAYYVIALCIIGLVVNISLWLTSQKIRAEFSGLIYAIANSLWFIGIISLAMGNLTLRAILSGRR